MAVRPALMITENLKAEREPDILTLVRTAHVRGINIFIPKKLEIKQDFDQQNFKLLSHEIFRSFNH